MTDFEDWYDVLLKQDLLNFEEEHAVVQTCKSVYYHYQPRMGNRRKRMFISRLKSVQAQCYMLTCPFTLKNFETFLSNTLSVLNGITTTTSLVNMSKVYEPPALFEGVFMMEERLRLLNHMSHVVDSCHKPRG